MTSISQPPPRWFMMTTVLLTLLILFMAVAETTLWTHYLIDEGEYLCLAGLVFVSIVAAYLYRRHKLALSLPFFLPWLIYPVITQADQIIDNLTINEMRLVAHAILAILFGAPIVILVVAAKHFFVDQPGNQRRHAWARLVPGLRQFEDGQVRDGTLVFATTLLLLELWIAHRYLGTLMVGALVGMGLFFMFYVGWRTPGLGERRPRNTNEKIALLIVFSGVVVSLGLYLGFKNRPGAYQGSPHFYHDPSQRDAAFKVNEIQVPVDKLGIPSAEVGVAVQHMLKEYARVLQDLVRAYYILDRNYNYAFHNALFLRNTPVLSGFRAKALSDIDAARNRSEQANSLYMQVRPQIQSGSALLAFLDDVHNYVAFNLRRASILEKKSAEFEQTQAGLQHATHLYEGEGKIVGVVLVQIIEKHQTILKLPELSRLAEPFERISKEVHAAYANRIVGF